MKSLEGLAVLILGLGDSGLAMARWCAGQGARVTVTDSRIEPPHVSTLRRELPQVQLRHGFDPSLLEGVQLLLKSPGLSPLDPTIEALLAQARTQGLMPQGELYLFAAALQVLREQRDYKPAVLAITGTNGKTTTTALTTQLVKGAGKRVAVAGNIGPTMLDTLAAALASETWPQAATPVLEPGVANAQRSPSAVEQEAGPASDDGSEPNREPTLDHASEPAAELLNEAAADIPEEHALPVLAPPPPAAVFSHLPEVWVLELSSFQLDGVSNFEPTAATILNITQDHLDWHGSMPAYLEAKCRIFGPHTVMVINQDDHELLAHLQPLIQAGIKTDGGKRFGKAALKTLARQCVYFGLQRPQHPGDFGWVQESAMAWLVRALELDPTVKRKKDEPPEELIFQRLMPADALLIAGRHNISNALAALALASQAGCMLAPMLHALRDYQGEPHRVQAVGHVQGVMAYDDSKGTNVGATVAALVGLGPDRAPHKLVVILGGDGKGQDFSPLREPVKRYARAVALIGKDAEQIELVLRDLEITLAHHSSLEAATRWAFEQAQGGDAVLLSPACASLDMFKNYVHRAQVFTDTVHAVAADHGEILS